MKLKDYLRFYYPVIFNVVKAIKKPYNIVNIKRLQKKRNKVFHENAEKVFGDFCKAFKDIDINFFLVFGTLLGAIRENNFISNDLDIDVGVFSDVDFEKLDNSLGKYGFVKQRQIDIYSKNNETNGFEMTYAKDLVSIDIFIFYQVNQANEYYTHAFMEGDRSGNFMLYKKVMRIPFPISGLKDYVFINNKVSIPENYTSFLESHYGKDFMTPNSNWRLEDSNMGKIIPNAIGIVCL